MDKPIRRLDSGFNDSTDLIGAPVVTAHGDGIVRSILKKNSGSTTTLGSDAAASILVVEMKDTRSENTHGIGMIIGATDKEPLSDPTMVAPSTTTTTDLDTSSINDSRPASQIRRVLHVAPEDLLSKPECAPGMCVDTTLGTGVLVGFRSSDGMHMVRLWQPRGEGSALAHLHRSALLRRLPAAIGIRVATPDGDGIVVGFTESSAGETRESSSMGSAALLQEKDDAFLVELHTGEMVFVEGQKISSPVAKVMPLVERVMDRSNNLVSARTKATIGTGARDLLARIEGSVQGVDTKAALEAAADTLDGKETAAGDIPGTATENGNVEERAVQLAEMTRNETQKIESLITSGRQKLDKLIAGALNGDPADGVGDIGEGIGEATTELRRLWEDGKEQLTALAGTGGEALELDRHFSTLKTLAKDSPELAKIVSDLEGGAARARELRGQLEATKTVGVLMDGKARLGTGLGEVMDSYRGDEGVAKARERGEKLFHALTEEDSPAMTKGMKLLRGAQKRVAAQGDGWSDALLSGWQSSSSTAVRDGRGKLAEAMRTMAGGRFAGPGGAGLQDAINLLKGDPATRATDASLRLLENLVLAFMEAVPNPRPPPAIIIGEEGDGGREEESSDTKKNTSLSANQEGMKDDGEYTEGIPREAGDSGGVSCDTSEGDAWDGTWYAQDLVDRFESGQLAEDVVRGIAKQASAQALTVVERLSEANLPEGSRALESLKLLQGHQAGQVGVDEAMSYALEYLNSDEGQSLAGGLVSHGERGLESLKMMSTDGAVGKVLERLTDPDLEQRILRGIEGIDPEELLDTAERAISDTAARTRLLDGIKDSTVDFLLEYLPHIEVPPISGTSTRVAYAITNLDLSGFRLRKEDVEVQVIDLSNGLEGAVKGGGASGVPSSVNSADGGDGTVLGDDAELAAVPWASLTKGDAGTNNNRHQQPQQRRTAAGAYIDKLRPGKTSSASPPQQRHPQRASPSAVGASPFSPLPAPERGENWVKGGDYVGEEFVDVERRGQRGSASPPRPREDMKPAEVLRVVARGVRAEFKTLQWACRQETFPYTRGTGTADATVVDGYVSLGFSIKRGVVNQKTGVEGPVLALSKRTVTLDRLDLKVANCRMAWLINLLTKLFSGAISTYVCRALQQQLDGHASDLLGSINGFAQGSWPFLLSLTSVKLQDLPLASEEELAMARGEGRAEGVTGSTGGIMAGIAGLGGASTGGGEVVVEHRPFDEAFFMAGANGPLKLKGFVQEEFGVVFDEDGPLGMQVDVEKGTSPSGRVIVSGLNPGGQAERLLGTPGEAMGTQAFSLVGAELLSVGGTKVEGMDGRKVLGLLRSCPRPVQMTFRCYVPDVAEATAMAAVGGDAADPSPPEALVKATFRQKSLGVKFRASTTLGTRVTRVGGFSRDMEGRMREAEASGKLNPGQLLYSVNGKRVLGQEFTDLVRRLQRIGRPVEFGMARNVDVDVTVNRPPLELELRRVSGRVTVTGFCEVPTALEASGAIQPGDVILSVNGIPLPGAGCYRRDAGLLVAPGMFPMRLRIHRPKQGTSAPDVGTIVDGVYVEGGNGGGGLEGSLSRLKQYQNAVSNSPADVLAATPDELSLTVEEGGDGRPVVASMPYVKGRLEKEGVIQPGMVLVGIGGAPVVGGHFASVSDCRRVLDSAEYPCTLTFRDMPRFVWLSRLLATGDPA